jgi:predicted nucleotidyltransferase
VNQFGVKSLALFGSVARDEAGAASDVDLLVEFDRPTGYFGLVRLQLFLQQLLGVTLIWALQAAFALPCASASRKRPFMSHRAWQERIQDILAALAEIDSFAAGMTREQFLADAKTLKAVAATDTL